MRANPKRDTKPEVRVRSGLHRAGLRFRKNLMIRLPDRSVRPDIVFTRAKLAVFIDGCFWHQCPEHGNVPRANVDYWVPKLRRNVERDRATDTALEIAGWRVIRAWEHEPVERTVERVLAAAAGRCATERRVRPSRVGMGVEGAPALADKDLAPGVAL